MWINLPLRPPVRCYRLHRWGNTVPVYCYWRLESVHRFRTDRIHKGHLLENKVDVFGVSKCNKCSIKFGRQFRNMEPLHKNKTRLNCGYLQNANAHKIISFCHLTETQNIPGNKSNFKNYFLSDHFIVFFCIYGFSPTFKSSQTCADRRVASVSNVHCMIGYLFG